MSVQRIGPHSASNRAVQLLSNKWELLILLSTCFVDFMCCLVLLILTSFTSANSSHAFFNWRHTTFDLFGLLCLRLALIFVIRFVVIKREVGCNSDLENENNNDNSINNSCHHASDVTVIAVMENAASLEPSSSLLLQNNNNNTEVNGVNTSTEITSNETLRTTSTATTATSAKINVGKKIINKNLSKEDNPSTIANHRYSTVPTSVLEDDNQHHHNNNSSSNNNNISVNNNSNSVSINRSSNNDTSNIIINMNTGRDADEENFYDWLHTRSAQRAASSMLHKKILIVTFVLLVLSNIVVALKCLSFQYTHPPIEQILMSLTVLWVNMELFTIDAVLENVGNTYDVYVRSIHFHPMQFDHEPKLTKCDLCNQRINGESFACKQCDFDCCIACYRRRCLMDGNNLIHHNHNHNIHHIPSHATSLSHINNESINNNVEEEVEKRKEKEETHVDCELETDVLLQSSPNISENNESIDLTRSNTQQENHYNKFIIKSNGITSHKSVEMDINEANTTDAVQEDEVHRTTNSRGINNNIPLSVKAEISPFYYIWRSFKFMWPFWRVLALSLICLCSNELIRVLLPNIKGHVLDTIINKDWNYFWHFLRLFCILSSVTLILGSVRSFCTMLILRNLMMGIRSQMFNQLVCQDIALYDVTTVGTLTSRMTNDVQAMIQPIRTLLNSVLSNMITLIGSIAMCLTVSWRLAMISLTMVGPIMYLTTTYAKWSMRLNRGVWDAMAQANSTATEAFVNIRTIKSFSTERIEQDKFGFAMERALRKTLRDAVVNSGTYVATHLLDLSASAILLGFGGYLVMTQPDELSVGQLVTFQLYAEMMNASYRELNGVLNEFTQSAGAAERVLAMLDRIPRINSMKGIILPHLKGEIYFHNVSFAYPSRPESLVLEHLSVHFPSNSMTALVGRSGSGKSTLLHLLLRLYDPLDGSIIIDHTHDLKNVHLTHFHQQCAVVAQDTQLFNTTIYDNIAYGVESCTMKDIVHAARRANAHDFIMQFPDGYQTNVGERGVQLSGGQKQRIAIARALLRRPRILLLDEATSALDAESESLVQGALDELIRDLHLNRSNNNKKIKMSYNNTCTIIVVAHRLSTVMNASNIIVIDNGRVAEQGKHDELLERKSIYWQLVNKQIHGQSNARGLDSVLGNTSNNKHRHNKDSLYQS